MGGARRPRCSIVIRAYNEELHIARLLVGIVHQTLREVEILLVDSGSTDATVAIASRYPVRILHLPPAEFSFGRSLNLGCSEARGEFIVVASAHVYPVYPDWLDRLLEPMGDPRVAVVYGKQRGTDTSRFSEQQVFRQWFPEASIRHQATPFCNNANAVIRSELWRRRAYNEDLPALEDVEWASWAMSQGFSVSYSAEAEVRHVHNETPAAVRNRYRREAMALRLIRPEERFGLADLARLFLLHTVRDGLLAIRRGVFWRTWREILWFRWMQFWGTYRGFATAGVLTHQLKEVFFYPGPAAGAAAPARRRTPPLDYASLEGRPAPVGRGPTKRKPR